MELLGSRCLIGGSVSEKGEAKKTYEVVCQLWLHSVISPPRVRLRFAERVAQTIARK